MNIFKLQDKFKKKNHYINIITCLFILQVKSESTTKYSSTSHHSLTKIEEVSQSSSSKTEEEKYCKDLITIFRYTRKKKVHKEIEYKFINAVLEKIQQADQQVELTKDIYLTSYDQNLIPILVAIFQLGYEGESCTEISPIEQQLRNVFIHRKRSQEKKEQIEKLSKKKNMIAAFNQLFAEQKTIIKSSFKKIFNFEPTIQDIRIANILKKTELLGRSQNCQRAEGQINEHENTVCGELESNDLVGNEIKELEKNNQKGEIEVSTKQSLANTQLTNAHLANYELNDTHLKKTQLYNYEQITTESKHLGETIIPNQNSYLLEIEPLKINNIKDTPDHILKMALLKPSETQPNSSKKKKEEHLNSNNFYSENLPSASLPSKKSTYGKQLKGLRLESKDKNDSLRKNNKKNQATSSEKELSKHKFFTKIQLLNKNIHQNKDSLNAQRQPATPSTTTTNDIFLQKLEKRYLPPKPKNPISRIAIVKTEKNPPAKKPTLKETISTKEKTTQEQSIKYLLPNQLSGKVKSENQLLKKRPLINQILTSQQLAEWGGGPKAPQPNKLLKSKKTTSPIIISSNSPPIRVPLNNAIRSRMRKENKALAKNPINNSAKTRHSALQQQNQQQQSNQQNTLRAKKHTTKFTSKKISYTLKSNKESSDLKNRITPRLINTKKSNQAYSQKKPSIKTTINNSVKINNSKKSFPKKRKIKCQPTYIKKIVKNNDDSPKSSKSSKSGIKSKQSQEANKKCGNNKKSLTKSSSSSQLTLTSLMILLIFIIAVITSYKPDIFNSFEQKTFDNQDINNQYNNKEDNSQQDDAQQI